MKRRWCLILAVLVVAISGLAQPAGASHERGGGHWAQPRPGVQPTVYIENRILYDWVDTHVLYGDWSWQGWSLYGNVENHVDLWAIDSQYRTRGGNDCTPRLRYIVVCQDPYTEYASAQWAIDGAQHISWCVVRMNPWNGAQNDGVAFKHEFGHCLGLYHGGTGVMNGGPHPDGHDRDAVAYAHQVFGTHTHRP